MIIRHITKLKAHNTLFGTREATLQTAPLAPCDIAKNVKVSHRMQQPYQKGW